MHATATITAVSARPKNEQEDELAAPALSGEGHGHQADAPEACALPSGGLPIPAMEGVRVASRQFAASAGDLRPQRFLLSVAADAASEWA